MVQEVTEENIKSRIDIIFVLLDYVYQRYDLENTAKVAELMLTTGHPIVILNIKENSYVTTLTQY